MGRQRTNDPQGVRARIVNAAYEAFTTRGYHATSMGDVRAAAGVSGGALSHHFPSKRSLALAVIEDEVHAAVRQTWIAPVKAAPNAAAGISAVFATIAAELDRRQRVTGCPLNNLAAELALSEEGFAAALAPIFKEWHAAIAEKLRDDDTARDAEALATTVIAAYSGAMVMAKTSQSTVPLKACAGEIASLLKSR